MTVWRLLFTLATCFFSFNAFSQSVNFSVEKKHWIAGWQTESAMTISRAGTAVVTHGNRIYMIGGVDGVKFLSTVESATIKSDGGLSAWAVISEMPQARGFVSAAVYENRIYVVGGGNGPYGKNLLRSVVSVPILKNGLLGEWRTEAEQMLTPRRCSKLIVKDNTLHVLGGFSGALLDTVESTQFSENGQLAPWSLQKNRMTMPRYVNEVKRVADYVFVTGGHHPSEGVGVNDVEYARLNDSALAWQSALAMKAGRYAFASAAHNNVLYVFGGISGTEYLNSSEKLPVAGNIGATQWSKATDLPEFMANFAALVVGDYIYIFGGSTRYEYMPNVWKATFNASGEVGYYGTQQNLEVFRSLNRAKKRVTKLPNSGRVLERIVTDGYTYMRVFTGGKEIWLAAPKVNVSLNAKIRFSEGVYMSNFRSKSLNRNFAAILFVGAVNVE